MLHHKRQLFLIVGAALSLPSCKTSSNSSAKDAAVDAMLASLPKASVSHLVPADGIEKYLQPYDGKGQVTALLGGLWWTDAKTVHLLMSFKTAKWDQENHTAYVLASRPGAMGAPSDGLSAPSQYYDFVPRQLVLPLYEYAWQISPDGKHIVFFEDDQIDPSQAVDPTDTPYTMDWVEDGHWVRHTKDMPDYQVRRIVKADGTREANYAKYLAAFGAYTYVHVPLDSAAAAATFKVGQTSLDIDLKPSELGTLVTIPSDSKDPDEAPRTSWLVSAQADVPVSLSTRSSWPLPDPFASRDAQGHPTLSTAQAIWLNTTDAAGGAVHLTMVKGWQQALHVKPGVPATFSPPSNVFGTYRIVNATPSVPVTLADGPSALKRELQDHIPLPAVLDYAQSDEPTVNDKIVTASSGEGDVILRAELVNDLPTKGGS